MKVIRSIHEMQEYVRKLRGARRKEPHKIGFVPTMGAFHDGHLSLMENAAKENSKVIVSIFVNPTQFGQGEDFERYPRDEKRDIKMAEKLKKVDCIFIPEAADMYPEGFSSYIQMENGMQDILCGASRPEHFKGVMTIVAKLLNIVQPDRIYLGQKDMQQAVILTKMINDMNYYTQVSICPIVREKDGLAMSSRNKYLTPEEREAAPALYKSLQMAESMIELGEKQSEPILKEIKRKLKEDKVEIDYVETVDPVTLEKVGRFGSEVLIIAAIQIGKTRLIDNTIVKIED